MILAHIKESIREKRSLFITTPNPEIIVEAQKNAQLKNALSCADISLPDGIGIVLALKMKGVSIARIPGRKFFEELLALAHNNRWRVFLLGASEESNRTSIERIKKEYPQITIQGSTRLDILEKIQAFSPHLLFVALGHPKQELLSVRVKEKLPGTTIMTIGGTLDYFSGTIPSPADIVSRLGFEWLFRLIIQPKRFKRILNAVVVFPLLVVRDKMKRDLWRK
jgi:N-acetylglucosaminyldiphosphoundecaprenol N-acetyl-beta-D-mannosaminyltransferase